MKRNNIYITAILSILILSSCATWKNHKLLATDKENLISCKTNFINFRSMIIHSDLPDDVIENIIPIIAGINTELNILLEQGKTMKVESDTYPEWKHRCDAICSDLGKAQQIFNEEIKKCCFPNSIQ